MSTRRLKRFFVMPFFVFLGLVGIHSLVRLFTSGFASIWAGPLLVALAFFVFMGWMVRSGTARTSARLPVLLTVSAMGVAITLVGSAMSPVPSGLALFYAITGFAAELLYVFWYSDLDRIPSTSLAIGQTLPELDLEEADGEPVSSRALLGRPAVLLFHRGNWCPLCTAQIRELVDRYAELEARDVQVVLISPQPHASTRKLAERFKVPFRFLVDPNGRNARRLGILHEGGVPMGMSGYDADTVFPTAIVTDPAGRILLADQTDNYRVRPEPDTFLDALNRAPC